VKAAQVGAADASVLTIAEKDQAVDEALDGLVTLLELRFRPPLLYLVEGIEEVFPPVAHRLVEALLDRDYSAADTNALGMFLEKALFKGFRREEVQARITFKVIIARKVKNTARLSVRREFFIGVKDDEVSKVRDPGPGDAFVVGFGDGVTRPTQFAGVLAEGLRF
jgi:hypothetical protein